MPETQINVWARALASQCREALNKLDSLMPWIRTLAATDWRDNFPQRDEIPTLHKLAQLHTNLASAVQQSQASKNDALPIERMAWASSAASATIW